MYQEKIFNQKDYDKLKDIEVLSEHNLENVKYEVFREFDSNNLNESEAGCLKILLKSLIQAHIA